MRNHCDTFCAVMQRFVNRHLDGKILRA
jgi:hypothetical protein